jgi:hypothetical protein
MWQLYIRCIARSSGNTVLILDNIADSRIIGILYQPSIELLRTFVCLLGRVLLVLGGLEVGLEGVLHVSEDPEDLAGLVGVPYGRRD